MRDIFTKHTKVRKWAKIAWGYLTEIKVKWLTNDRGNFIFILSKSKGANPQRYCGIFVFIISLMVCSFSGPSNYFLAETSVAARNGGYPLEPGNVSVLITSKFKGGFMPEQIKSDCVEHTHPIDLLSKQQRLLDTLFYACRSIEAEYSFSGLTDLVLDIQTGLKESIQLLENPNPKEVV